MFIIMDLISRIREALITSEVSHAKEVRQEYIPLLPIALMYNETDYRMFLNKMRDYLWFDDGKDLR
jgi:hypothetical protein